MTLWPSRDRDAFRKGPPEAPHLATTIAVLLSFSWFLDCAIEPADPKINYDALRGAHRNLGHNPSSYRPPTSSSVREPRASIKAKSKRSKSLRRAYPIHIELEPSQRLAIVETTQIFVQDTSHPFASYHAQSQVGNSDKRSCRTKHERFCA